MADDKSGPAGPGGNPNNQQRPAQPPNLNVTRPEQPGVRPGAQTHQRDRFGNPVDATSQDGFKRISEDLGQTNKGIRDLTTAIREQLTDLKDELRDALIEDLPKKLGDEMHSGGGEGEEQRKGVNASQAAYRAHLNDLVRYGKPLPKDFLSISTSLKKMKDEAVNKVTSDLMLMRRNMVQFGADVLSGSYAVRRFQESLQAGMKESATGLGSVITDFISDVKGNISRTETLQGIRKNLEQGGMAFQMAGMTVSSYSDALKKARGSFMTGEMYTKLTFGEQNELIQQIYEQMVAQGASTRLDSDDVRSRTNRQFGYFEEVAKNTGKTVQELMKITEQTEDVNELAARGAISQDMVPKLMALQNLMPKEQFQQLLDAFKYGSAEVAASQKGNIVAAVTTGQAAMTNFLKGQLESGAQVDNNLVAAAGQIAKSNQMIGNSVASFIVNPQNYMGAINRMGGAKNTNEKDANTAIESTIRRFEGFLKEWPILDRLLQVGSAIAGLGMALGALGVGTVWNTVATTANTTALYALGRAVGALAAKSGFSAPGTPGEPTVPGEKGPGKLGSRLGKGLVSGGVIGLGIEMLTSRNEEAKEKDPEHRETPWWAYLPIGDLTYQLQAQHRLADQMKKDKAGIKPPAPRADNKAPDPDSTTPSGPIDVADPKNADLLKQFQDMSTTFQQMNDLLRGIRQNTQPSPGYETD